MRDRLPFSHRLRRRTGALIVDNFFNVLARAGRLHPLARPERHGVEVTRDLAYLPTGAVEHRLDVYRPIERSGPLPVMLYVHGGGFRILSKDTHWMMALGFARRGYVVVNISYRLAPKHPFPAAVADACAAYEWVVAHAAEHGGDPARLILAGESAGANLVTGLAVAAAYRREEPFARAVFDTGVAPKACVPACGILQVSDTERFARRKPISTWLSDRLTEVTDAYLGGADLARPGALDLADPLNVLERGVTPDRPLPPFFVPVGTRDILLDDTRRLKAALDQLGVECDARFYEGEVHAFHAMVFRRAARKCWADTFEFLDRHVPPG
ncbi:MAG TPA: alpha/beta hydrolase [Polyangia bacterium]|nr:alpha/beta hydrolase [Polyangia bacterium]